MKYSFIKENYDFEHGTTCAFNTYAENILIRHIDDEKYLGKGKWFNFNRGVMSEIDFRKLVCMYLSDKVDEILNWNKVKKDYNNRVAKIPFDKFNTEFAKYQNKLKTFGKLKYCTEILRPLNKLGYDLDTSNYLLVLYYKLLSLLHGQDFNCLSINPQLKEQLQDDKVYGYLLYASLESFSSSVNYNQLFDSTLDNLIKCLFEHIFIKQFEFANSVIETTIGTDDYGNILPIYNEMFVLDDDMDDTTEAIAEAEKHFNIWLIEEMHLLNNGMEF